MIVKNKETSTFSACCDCCYEWSDYYDNWNECSRGIKEEGWHAHYDVDEGEWQHFCPECMKG